MSIPFELIVEEDLELGRGSVTRTMPAGGTAQGQKIGIHTFESANVFNVRDYGAVGDGVADDSAAIQAALDAVTSIQGNPQTNVISGRVYLPPGSYRLRSALVITKNSTIFEGAGTGATLLFAEAATGINVGASSGAADNRTIGTVLRDFTLIASGAAVTRGIHLRNIGVSGASTGPSETVLEDLDLRTSSPGTVDGIHVDQGCSNVRIVRPNILKGFRYSIRIDPVGSTIVDSINSVDIVDPIIGNDAAGTNYAIFAKLMTKLSIRGGAITVGGVPANTALRALYLESVNTAQFVGVMFRHNNAAIPVTITSNANWRTNGISFVGCYFDRAEDGVTNVNVALTDCDRVSFLCSQMVLYATGTQITVTTSGTVTEVYNIGTGAFLIDDFNTIGFVTQVAAAGLQLISRFMGQWIARTSLVVVDNFSTNANKIGRYLTRLYDNTLTAFGISLLSTSTTATVAIGGGDWSNTNPATDVELYTGTYNTPGSAARRVHVTVNGITKIGNTSGSPLSGAIADVQSTAGGLGIPRMTTAQRDALVPANGLLIYNTTTNKFQGYEASAWANLV